MEPIIRPVQLTDFAAMLEIYRYYVEETTISFEEEVPSLEAYSARLNQMQLKYPILVAEVDQKVIGYAYAHAFRDFSAYDQVAEITVYLAKELVARGLGGKLYDQLEPLLAQKGISKVLACITADNEPSRLFHQRRNYQLIGEFKKIGYKFNQWLDIIWLEKELN